MKIKKPTNRAAEVLALMMQNPKKQISYVDIAMELHQINAHKMRGELEKYGVKFKKTPKIFTNRFGRVSTFYLWKLDMPLKAAKSVYDVINAPKKTK